MSQQCSPPESVFLKILYESKLKKYHSISPSLLKNPSNESDVTGMQEIHEDNMICIPSASPLYFPETISETSEENWNLDNNLQISNVLLIKIQSSLDFVVSQAEKLYYNCEYQKCKKVTESVLKKDSYHTDCLPVHIACMVELKESNSKFSTLSVNCSLIQFF